LETSSQLVRDPGFQLPTSFQLVRLCGLRPLESNIAKTAVDAI